jgi:GAF domain-containing protein
VKATNVRGLSSVRAPLPANEAERLEALYRYDILDTPPEVLFDDLTALASFITGSPIATFTLVDAERQWFKSQVGLGVHETERDAAFCGYTILGDEMLVIPDATRDVRFADNRLVIDEPGIRFYAGMPVRSREGLNVGTLCVIDRQPRLGLLEHQRLALEAIARQASTLLELRRTSAELAAAMRGVRALSSVLPICGHCLRIHEGNGKWQTAEQVMQATGAKFTQVLCPDCLPSRSLGVASTAERPSES